MDYLKSWKHKLQIAGAFTWRDWLTFLEAWGWMSFYRVALLGVSYQRLSGASLAQTSLSQPVATRVAEAERLAVLTRYAAHSHLPAMTCLPRSLALHKMLTDRNIPAQVKIGVRSASQSLQAHAWVEVYGNPLGETEDVKRAFHPLNALRPMTADYDIRF